MAPAPDRLLTVEEAADLLGTKPRFTRRLIAERRIRFTRIGRHVRIPESALRVHRRRHDRTRRPRPHARRRAPRTPPPKLPTPPPRPRKAGQPDAQQQRRPPPLRRCPPTA